MTNQEATTQKKFYVYLHYAPEPRGLFYIGKGNDDRVNLIPRTHNKEHTKVVTKYGTDNITVTLIPCVSSNHALEVESLLIASYKRAGCNLTNLKEIGNNKDKEFDFIDDIGLLAFKKIRYDLLDVLIPVSRRLDEVRKWSYYNFVSCCKTKNIKDDVIDNAEKIYGTIDDELRNELGRVFSYLSVKQREIQDNIQKNNEG